MTSAGERDPSVSISSARTSSSSLRTLTVIPVAFSNPLTSASVVCTCWPLYSVIDWPEDDAEAAGTPPLSTSTQHVMTTAAALEPHRRTFTASPFVAPSDVVVACGGHPRCSRPYLLARCVP